MSAQGESAGVRQVGDAIAAKIYEEGEVYWAFERGTDIPALARDRIARAAIAAMPAQSEALGWRQAVDDALVHNMLTADDFATPQEAVRALIDIETTMALDPAVSEHARALQSDALAMLETARMALGQSQAILTLLLPNWSDETRVQIRRNSTALAQIAAFQSVKEGV